MDKVTLHRGETYQQYRERVDKKLPVDCNCTTCNLRRNKNRPEGADNA